VAHKAALSEKLPWDISAQGQIAGRYSDEKNDSGKHDVDDG
jgi:hypothetical protein